MIHQKIASSIIVGVKKNKYHGLRSVSDHPANSTFTVLFPDATIEGSVISWGISWDDLVSVAFVKGSNCPLGLKPHANRDTDMVREVSDSMGEKSSLIFSLHLGIPKTQPQLTIRDPSSPTKQSCQNGFASPFQFPFYIQTFCSSRATPPPL